MLGNPRPPSLCSLMVHHAHVRRGVLACPCYDRGGIGSCAQLPIRRPDEASVRQHEVQGAHSLLHP